MLKKAHQFWTILWVFGPVELASRTYGFLMQMTRGVKAYQRPLTDCIGRFAGTEATFVDIGAADGNLVQTVEPEYGTVLAVEPAPHHLKTLNRLQKRGELGKTQIIACAVGDKNGTIKLGFNESNPDDNSAYERADLTGYVSVKQTKLDDILSQHHATTPTIIKMDVQGFEGHIMAGATKTLKAGCVIVMEFWPWGLTRAGTEPMDLLASLAGSGYSLCRLSGKPYSTKSLSRMSRLGANNQFVVADILVIKRSQS